MAKFSKEYNPKIKGKAGKRASLTTNQHRELKKTKQATIRANVHIFTHVRLFLTMKNGKFNKYAEHTDDLTVAEVAAINYTKRLRDEERTLEDFFDRTDGKAVDRIESSVTTNTILPVQINFLNGDSNTNQQQATIGSPSSE